MQSPSIDEAPGVGPGSSEPVSGSDAAFIKAVRAGDMAAYGELWARHHPAVVRFGRQFGSESAAEDLASEVFARLLRVLQAGRGPDENVRPYLLTSVRRLRIDIATRYEKRVGLSDDTMLLETAAGRAPGTVSAGTDDEVLAELEASTAWKAFAELPERWRTVLWHTLIEETPPAELAPILGATPNAIAALSMRAREGLRQAFLAAHARDTDDPVCHTVVKRLGAHARGALATRERRTVEQHLSECDRCTAAYLEISDLNRTLKVIVLPVVLGGTAFGARYLRDTATAHAASAGVAVAPVASLRHGGRVLRQIASRPLSAAVAGVAAVAVIGGATAFALRSTAFDTAQADPTYVTAVDRPGPDTRAPVATSTPVPKASATARVVHPSLAGVTPAPASVAHPSGQPSPCSTCIHPAATRHSLHPAAANRSIHAGRPVTSVPAPPASAPPAPSTPAPSTPAPSSAVPSPSVSPAYPTDPAPSDTPTAPTTDPPVDPACSGVVLTGTWVPPTWWWDWLVRHGCPGW